MQSTFLDLPLDTQVGPVSGVVSFNGRNGVVTSQAGDYSADEISYNGTASGIPATDVQAAIDYLRSQSQTSATPGFSFGRAGSVNAGTYLQCETVPSNVAGRWVYLNNAKITKIFVANELANAFTLEVFYSDGNNTNVVSAGTVTLSGGFGQFFTVNWAIPVNKQLSIKIADSSAFPAKNILCGLQLTGNS